MNKSPLVAGVLLALLAWPGQGRADDPRLPVFHDALTNHFLVTTGYTEIADIIVAVDRRLLDSAQASNATQPYKRFHVPVCPLSTNQPEPLEAFMGAFRLRPDEAVVYVGPTPPSCAYFSFVPFMMVRYFNSLAWNGDLVWASVSDPLNLELIKTEGTTNIFGANTMIIFTPDNGTWQSISNCARAAGYPASMINLYVMPSSLLYLGLAHTNDLFVTAIRTAYITNKDDENYYLTNNNYGIVYRVTPAAAGTLDPLPAVPWRDRPHFQYETNLVPGLTDSLESLKQAILAQTPCVQFRSFESVRWFGDSKDVLEAEGDTNSPNYRLKVVGDSSDTPYLRTSENGAPANFTLGPTDLLVVYGVNHQASGLATYANLTLYGDWKWSTDCGSNAMPRYLLGCNDSVMNGVAGTGSHEYGGSAAQYLPNDPLAPYLYAVAVTRGLVSVQLSGADCILRWPAGALQTADNVAGPWSTLPNAAPPTYTCSAAGAGRFYRVVLPSGSVIVPEPAPLPPDPNFPSPPYQAVSARGISLDSPMLVGYRAYVNTNTCSGPAYSDIIPDRAIWFKLQ